MHRLLLILFAGGLATALSGQNQIDFRGLASLNLEKKLSQSFSVTAMAAGIQTYDFQELGFFWFDAGAKYKLSRHFGVNVNYRPLFSRNRYNFYTLHHILYADLDFSWGRGPWSYGGTLRLQQSGFTDFLEGSGGSGASLYSRNRFGVRYRINYYWQPFAEGELFVPLDHPTRERPDQWRFALGVGRTFNRYVKLELYGQIQQQINRSPKNTNYLAGVNWYFRF